MQSVLYRFKAAEECMTKFQNNSYQYAIIKYIVTKCGRPSSYSLRDIEAHTDRLGNIDSTVKADQEYICLVHSDTPPSACYKYFPWTQT